MMTDLFEEKARDWDTRPLPVQISTGVFDALTKQVTFTPEQIVMDFGAGTGLVCTKVAPLVKEILAVDISAAMLEQLGAKPELADKCEIYCQDILVEPLERKADVVVSAMAMHHVEDTVALLATLYDHLTPGGQIAIADLDKEEGDFHPPGIEGVYHFGFDREELTALIEGAGFNAPEFVTAVEIDKGEKTYPIFLVTATRPA